MSWENPSEPPEPPIPEVAWDVRREGRAWGADEAQALFALTLERFEMSKGWLFWSEADRVTLLGLLLENVGMDRAVRLGNADLWRSAIRAFG